MAFPTPHFPDGGGDFLTYLRFRFRPTTPPPSSSSRGRTGKNKIWPLSRLGDVVVGGDKLNNVPTWHGHGSSHPGFYFMDISVPFACPAAICQFCTPFSQKATEGILAQYICQLLLCALQESRFSIFGLFFWVPSFPSSSSSSSP